MEQIGFIGFGEAASLIAKGLSQNNRVKMYAYDVNADHPTFGKNIKGNALKTKVKLVQTLKGLTERSTILFNLTSAKFALSTAKQVVSLIKKDHLYIDMNAASPMIKQEIEQIISKQGQFTDGAVMESIPNFLHEVPILVSGKQANKAVEFSKRVGMNFSYVNDKAGSASAIKMIRSIFMKGFSMLLLETLAASNKYGVNQEILSSLEQSIQSDTLTEIAHRLIGRSAIHAERRVAEMKEVISTLEQLKIDDIMSQATANKLKYLSDKNLVEYFDNVPPNNFKDVIEALN